MRRFAVALLATIALGTVGCDAEKVKALEAKSASLSAENELLTSKVKELQASLAVVTKQRDDLKAAAAAAPPADAPAPVKKGTKKAHKKHH